MTEERGLIAAYVLDGKGGATALDWAGVGRWKPEDGLLWVILDLGPEAVQWLLESSGVSRPTAEALTAEDPRPRCSETRQGILVFLRGVNMNPGADPEDMVALRLWTDGRRVLSVRRRVLLAVQAVRKSLDDGDGPDDLGDLLVVITAGLSERMGVVVDQLGGEMDDLEHEVQMPGEHEARQRLADLRRRAIVLRRYIAPQREALARLSVESVLKLGDLQKLHIRETHDEVTRYVEDLDATRERAIVVHEELVSRLAETLNRRMYILGVVTTIFLPLGLLTGLLGINVGGMPGAEWDWAFWVVVGLLGVAGVVQYAVLRWLKMV